MDNGYLTTTEAAARLGLAPRTLERWRWAGTGPRFRKLGGAVRYVPSDLNSWADAATRSSTSAPGPAPDRAA
jgi:predicted DNA-binding transcriptional regulator AlpA